MHPDVYKRPLLWCLAALIIVLVCFYRPAPSERDVFHFLAQKEVTLTGRVESFPVQKKKYHNVPLKVLTINGKPAQGVVYARFADFTPQWKDILEVSGRLQQPYGIDLLGNFNWRNYLAQKHIFTEIKVQQSQVLAPAAAPYRWIRALRADILQVFEKAFPPELASIAGGVLLGERGEISPALYTAFQDSGAIHLLVASGGNVGFVTLITLGVCSLFGMGRKKMMIAALGVAGIYTLAAGADAPLVRAYFMAVCACVGYLLGCNSGVFQGLLVSCFIILCLEPASVFETGFQMSFLATLAIILCLSNYRLPGKWPPWVRFFVQIFLATLATQLVLLPVFTNVFYKVSLTGLVSNMLLVPWASLLMGMSFAYYVAETAGVGFVLHLPTLWCLEGFKNTVEFFASFQLSALPVAAWSTGVIAAFYAGLFWVFHLPQKKFARRLLWPCAGAAVLALALQSIWGARAEVYLMSEWNKRAALVRMPSGQVFVLGDDLKETQISAALHRMGVRRAEAVLAFVEKEGNDLAPVAKEGRVIRPFENGFWPGKSWQEGPTQITLKWGEHITRAGREWTNAGYSGTEADDVSYCLQEKRKEVCVGARAYFVRVNGTIFPYQRNKTVRVKI